MTKSNHKYRVNVYVGKEVYKELEQDAEFMGVSIATLTKILITTGYQFAKGVESNYKNKKGEKSNGNK